MMLRSSPLSSRLAQLALPVMLASLAACAQLPDAQLQPQPLSKSFAGQARLQTQVADVPPPALDTWWDGFKDPVLSDLVQRALDQNLDLAAALARVEQARAVAQGAGAQRLPQIGLDGQIVRQRQSLKSPEGELASAFPGYAREQTLQSLGIGASWEADLAGGLRQGEAAAVAEWQAATASQLGARVTVVAEVADAYFRGRGAQARIEVAQAQVRTQEQLLTLLQERFDHGLANQRELSQARAQLLQARGTLPPLRTDLATQLHRLDVLIGAQAGSQAVSLFAAAPAVIRVPALPADITPADLMRRRPDVIAAERELDADQARIGIAKAEYYPSLSLGGLIGAQSLHGALISPAAFQPQALIGLHWRLFDFGRIDAEVAQARGARNEALVQVRQRMLRATEDVENALVCAAELEAQRLDLTEEISARETARDAAQDAYIGGSVSLVEVLIEDQQLLAARDHLALLQSERARAAVAEFRALGGGWIPPKNAKESI